MTAKIYTKRDSITAILRKKGVDKSKYNDFIKKVEGGFQLVEETKPQPKKPKTEATDLVKSLVDNAGKEKPEKKKAKKDVVTNWSWQSPVADKWFNFFRRVCG